MTENDRLDAVAAAQQQQSAVLDRVVTRLGHIEEALLDDGLSLPPWSDEVVDRWIRESAERHAGAEDPRR
jgi:hypothetical protein